MTRTIGNFKWVTGSINDNITALLKRLGISYMFDHFGKIIADVYGVGLWQEVKYTLTNPQYEVYAVYID